ncbi:MAG: hypothetical protein ABIC04_01245 [Nanoarchaeota archaeon]
MQSVIKTKKTEKTVFHSKRHRGWLVRVLAISGPAIKQKFLVNAFAPNGLLVSYTFRDSLTALSFANFLIKKINKGWSC